MLFKREVDNERVSPSGHNLPQSYLDAKLKEETVADLTRLVMTHFPDKINVKNERLSTDVTDRLETSLFVIPYSDFEKFKEDFDIILSGSHISTTNAKQLRAHVINLLFGKI